VEIKVKVDINLFDPYKDLHSVGYEWIELIFIYKSLFNFSLNEMIEVGVQLE
jgi:hypothetical protein